MFDLDETLIHCNENSNIPSDVVLPIKFPTGEIIEVTTIQFLFVFEINSKNKNKYDFLLGWDKCTTILLRDTARIK